MRPLSCGRSIMLVATLAFGSFAVPARAAFVATESTQVSQLAANLFFYSYTINVSASSTVSASEFDLAINGPINVASIISPSNFFTFYTPGDSFISFTAFDDGTSTNGIRPGSSGTFSFTSSYAPVTMAYQVGGLDSSNFTTPVIQGMALAPGVVPEPSSLILCSLGACGVWGLFARSRHCPTV